MRGFKTSMSDPDMERWTYCYDALGQLTSKTDATSQITLLSYDYLGRTKSRLETSNASAILDRLLHHAVTLNVRGNSYRLKEKLKAGLVRSRHEDSSAQPGGEV